MYISIIYVCRLWNGGAFYKEGFETLSFIVYKRLFHDKFMNSPRCMGVTFLTFALYNLGHYGDCFFLLCVMQNATLGFTSFHIVDSRLFRFWTMSSRVVIQIQCHQM
jgi:hypothetical protein